MVFLYFSLVFFAQGSVTSVISFLRTLLPLYTYPASKFFLAVVDFLSSSQYNASSPRCLGFSQRVVLTTLESTARNGIPVSHLLELSFLFFAFSSLLQ